MPDPEIDYLFDAGRSRPDGWPKDEAGNPRWISLGTPPEPDDEHLGPYERPSYMRHQEPPMDLTKARRVLLETGDTVHWTAAPKRAQAREPVGPRWKFVWITEGAVILLLLSYIAGGEVLPWLIDR